MKSGQARSQVVRCPGAVGMLLLQLFAVAVLPSADAMLDAERASLPLHIESPHNEDCHTGHDHLSCQVVRSLSAVSAGTGIGTTLHVAAPLYQAVRLGRNDTQMRPALRGPTAPRPPPLG